MPMDQPSLPLDAQVRLMKERGYVLGNIDCTIIAQRPKLSPHKVRQHTRCAAHCLPAVHSLSSQCHVHGEPLRTNVGVANELIALVCRRALANLLCYQCLQEAIRQNLCELLEAHESVVNLKAKTHERVDSIGEERSIACHAVALLMLKP